MRYSDFVYFKTHLNKFESNDFQNQDESNTSNTNISYLKKKCLSCLEQRTDVARELSLRITLCRSPKISERTYLLILQRGGFLVSRAIANQNNESRHRELIRDGGM